MSLLNVSFFRFESRYTNVGHVQFERRPVRQQSVGVAACRRKSVAAFASHSQRRCTAVPLLQLQGHLASRFARLPLAAGPRAPQPAPRDLSAAVASSPSAQRRRRWTPDQSLPPQERWSWCCRPALHTRRRWWWGFQRCKWRSQHRRWRSNCRRPVHSAGAAGSGSPTDPSAHHPLAAAVLPPPPPSAAVAGQTWAYVATRLVSFRRFGLRPALDFG